MEKRRRRKHRALRGVLVGCVEHRPFFDTRTDMVDQLERCVAAVATPGRGPARAEVGEYVAAAVAVSATPDYS